MKNIEKLSNYRVSSTHNLPTHTEYTKALLNDYPQNAFCEQKAPTFKSKWRELAFQVNEDHPMDLEIGTGNGFHFSHYVQNNPDRAIVGLELKYKPLIQTVRRALDCENKKFIMARYDARCIDDLFAEGELNNVYIHFPDPWAKDRQVKHRTLQTPFLNYIYKLQRSASFLEFKTDHEGYFHAVRDCIKDTNYEMTRYTEDLHNSEWASENFQTHFEKLWTSKGLKSYMLRLEKK